MTKSRAFASALGVLACGSAALAASAASAQQSPAASVPPGHFCGGFGGSGAPVIKPVIYPQLQFDRSNPGFDCQAWQAFIYLNWPAQTTGPRGTPNPNAKFGAPGTTVWETYKTLEQTFLPAGADPGPWSGVGPLAGVPQKLAAQAGSGRVRVLARTSKISRTAIRNVVHSKIDQAILDSIVQAGGGTLYDQQSVPVYYEIAMNQDQYNYIQQNGLYNADTQLTFAQKTTIALPGGATQYGPTGAIEMKAAWKVLTPAEAKSNRFHTAQAILVGKSANQPVTVGLVGFHIFQMLGQSNQGIWATFAQVDNAPVGSGGTQPFTFYNPACQPSPCPVNNEQTNPTQVVQMFPDDAAAVNVNKNMLAMIRQYNPAAPWQYYKLVNVQWPLTPVALSSLPIPANEPLPGGDPNTGPIDKGTLMNAVLETFQQAPGTSCLACHIGATISPSQSTKPSPPPQNASSYSFMFGYAQSPAAAKPKP
ncbi:MAG TPA: hypothetical protein VF601_01000 [Beijerinckiaceae bacterium]|jgi:hypothetical protein